MKITQTWYNRLALVDDLDQEEFTYADLEELWGVSRPRITQKLSEISEKAPGGVEKRRAEDGRHKIITFNMDKIMSSAPEEVEDEDEAPEFMANHTYENINDEIEDLDLPEEYEIEYRPTDDWSRRFQRGRIDILIYKPGMKYHTARYAIRLDNGIVLNPPQEIFG